MTKSAATLRATSALALAAATSLSFVDAAGECIDYEEYIHWVAAVNVAGGDVVVSGDLAYATDPFSVIDVSDPSNPQIVGSVDTPGNVVGVAISGDLAFACNSILGLQVIDVTNPSNPLVVGTLDTPDFPHGVATAGGLVYVADGTAGLHVVDVSNPASPQIVGSVDTPDQALNVTVSGSYAYVSDRNSGLQVVDISVPSAPQIVGSFDTVDAASAAALSGSHLYLTATWSGLLVIDVSNPSSPQIVGSCDPGSYLLGVAIVGSLAFVGNGERGLQVIDIATPESPVYLGGIPTQINLMWAGGHASGTVTISDNHAYLADGNGLQIIDLGNLQLAPAQGLAAIPGELRSVASAGHHAYVARSNAGLAVVDVLSPTNPLVVGNVDTPGTASDILVSHGYAYVADGVSGVQVIDVSTPVIPVIEAKVNTPGTAFALSLTPSALYVADLYGGLQVVNISNPTSPTILGWASTAPYAAYDVVTSGNYAYVAATGLHVIDVTTPAAPHTVDSLLPSAQFYYVSNVEVVGTYVYATVVYAEDDGARRRPFASEHFDNGAAGEQRERTGGESGGLSGNDPLTAVGLWVLDVSNPLDVQVVNHVNTLNESSGLFAAGSFLYLSDGIFAVQVFDISDPGSPRAVGCSPYGGGPVLVAGETLYLPDPGWGLRILPVHCATAGVFAPELASVSRGLLSSWPNPTRGAVTLRFTAPSRGAASLRIHDVLGRQVRRLQADAVSPGAAGLVTWDGRDDVGHPVASGAYFVRLQSPEGDATSRVVLVR